jgi:hypothetical protein
MTAGPKIDQRLAGLRALPVPLAEDALVISDNGDIYGTVSDLAIRDAG